MDWNKCKKLILQDYNRKKTRKLNRGEFCKYFVEQIVSESFKVTFWFRILSYLRNKGCLCKVFFYPLRLYYMHVSRVTGIQLPIGTKIGGGIIFCHFGYVVIANSVIIGDNVSIHPGVIIGRIFAGPKQGVPTIGSNVVIFAGAKIVGNITIGDNAVIGPNAVVIDDVPQNAVVVGVPAKVVSNDSSRCFNEKWGKSFEHSYR